MWVAVRAGGVVRVGGSGVYRPGAGPRAAGGSCWPPGARRWSGVGAGGGRGTDESDLDAERVWCLLLDLFSIYLLLNFISTPQGPLKGSHKHSSLFGSMPRCWQEGCGCAGGRVREKRQRRRSVVCGRTTGGCSAMGAPEPRPKPKRRLPSMARSPPPRAFNDHCGTRCPMQDAQTQVRFERQDVCSSRRQA